MNGPDEHPVAQLDEVVHQRFRLGVLAYLSRIGRAEFTVLRDALALTDGNLNRHLAALVTAGFVNVTKPAEPGRRARTWVQITPEGRRALTHHVAALRRLLDEL